MQTRYTSTKNPCPVCRKPHGCKVNDDLSVFCIRGDSASFDAAPGYRYIKPLRDGMGGLWRPDDESNDRQWTPRQRDPDDRETLTDETLNAEYRKLIAQLDLSTYHRRKLAKRGLDDAAIDYLRRVGFRTFIPKKRVAGVLDIPGVAGGTLTGSRGFLIPTMTPWGHVIGGQTATDSKRAGKYLWLKGAGDVRETGLPIAFAYAFPEFAPARTVPTATLSITSVVTVADTGRGAATVTATITDGVGTTIATTAKRFARQMTAQAEHNALLLGLQLALDCGVVNLTIAGVGAEVRRELNVGSIHLENETLARLTRELLDRQRDYTFVDDDVTAPPAVTDTMIERGDQYLDTRDIWFVDGVGKAWYTALRHKCVVLGSPMANHAANEPDLTKYLRALSAETCTHAPDAGDVTNTSAVPATNVKLHRTLAKLGYSIRVAWWGQSEKIDGTPNDIDDRAAGMVGVEFITPDEFFELHDEQIKLSIDATRFYKPGIYQVPEPAKPPRSISYREPKYFDEGHRRDAVRTAWLTSKICHDRTFAGGGKSRDFDTFHPSDFDAYQILWVTPDAISPEYPDWKYYRGRDHGRIERESDGRIVSAAPDTDPDALLLESNCVRAGRADYLAERNIAPTADKLCHECEFAAECKNTPGWYQYDRHVALSAPRVRLHPAALDTKILRAADGKLWSKTDDDRPGTVIVCDDVSPWTTSITVAPKQIRAFVREYVDFLEPLPDLRDALERLAQLARDRDDTKRRVNRQHSAIISELPVLRQLDPDALAALYEVETIEIESAEDDADRAAALGSRWIEAFVEAASDRTGHLYTYNGVLTIATRNERFIATLKHPAVVGVVIADATARTEHLDLWLDADRPIPSIAQLEPDATADLRFTQIIGIGDCGYSRTKRQKREIDRLKQHTRARLPHYASIDIKRAIDPDEINDIALSWRSTSRGSNAAKDSPGLLVVGTPRANLAALYAQFALMTRTHPDADRDTLTNYPVRYSNRAGHWVRCLRESDDPAFAEFCHQDTTAELWQGFNRLRHARRAGETLDIVFVSEYPLDVPVRAVTADEFVSGATDIKLKTEVQPASVTEIEINSAAEDLRTIGQALTQKAIAEICGVGSHVIRDFFAKAGRDWKTFKSAETRVVKGLCKKESGDFNDSESANNNTYICIEPTTFCTNQSQQGFQPISPPENATPDRANGQTAVATAEKLEPGTLHRVKTRRGIATVRLLDRAAGDRWRCEIVPTEDYHEPSFAPVIIRENLFVL